MNVAHKSILPILLVAGLALAARPPVWSQTTTNQIKSSAETARDEAKQRRAKAPIAKGTLETIDLLRRQLKLKTEDGMRTFTYTPRTYIFRDKEKITVDKLKVGEVIALRFNVDENGAAVAQRIKARTPSELMEPPPSASADATNPPAATPR